MENIKNIIEETRSGEIFSATFVKKDGTLRKIKARCGVTKGTNGVGLSFDPLTKNLLPVFDMDKQAFRMINLNTLKEVKIKGKTIKFN